MRVLYIAYSCSPYNGTEDKLGWYIPFEVSKTNEVWIITKPEGKMDIENFLKQNLETNIHVIYYDISDIFKKIFVGAFYSGRLNVWNKEVHKHLENILISNKIQIIHQINPVEFRSIGDYGNFEIPFVCGPVGGGEYAPFQLLKYCKGNFDKELIRYFLNLYYRKKIRKRLSSIDKLMFANEETKQYLVGNAEYEVYTEIGSEKLTKFARRNESDYCRFLFAGRLVYRKGLLFLLKAMDMVPDEYKFNLTIVGDGPEKDKIIKIIDKNERISNRVEFVGKVSFVEMAKEYNNVDYLIMPSLRETTGSVVLEALERGIPVITINRYGAKNILNEVNSITYELNTDNPEQELSNTIIRAIKCKNDFSSDIIANSTNLFTFESKSKKYIEIYRNIISGSKK